jgi:hypothetical protein
MRVRRWTPGTTIDEHPFQIKSKRAFSGRTSEAETVNLTMLIATINAWNRVAISFRTVPPVRAKAAVA